MSTRPYRQTRRAESTEATRRRILEAARDQLVSGERFTIDAVARRAGVSRPTVYAGFTDGAQLREAVFDDLATSGGLGEIPSAFTAEDPVAGVRRLAEVFCGFYRTHRVVLRRLNALAALAAGAGRRPPGRNRRRRGILTRLLQRVASSPGRPAPDVDALVPVLHALTSFEFFDQLASAAGADEACRRIPALVEALVLSPPR